VVLSTKLGNTLQQAAYEKYLTGMENSVYLTSEPATGSCTVPLGPENAPIVDISKPTANQSVVAGSNLEISGSVAFQTGISSLEVKFDATSITAGATVQPNGSYVVNYLVPVGTPIGTHMVTVNVVDSAGKLGTATVNIGVVVAVIP